MPDLFPMNPKQGFELVVGTVLSSLCKQEKAILEAKALSIGLNVVSLIRMLISHFLKQDFAPTFNQENNKNNGRVIKQYAVL